MPVNIDMLKTPRFWMMVTPIVLTIWTFMSLFQMLDRRKEALAFGRQSDEVDRYKALILTAQQKSGQAAGTIKNFDPVASARDCAISSGIAEKRLTRASSSQQVTQKDGTMLFRENYILTGVNLGQAAKFIDQAERNYANLRCTQLSLNPVRGNKDMWDINVDLEYRKQ